MSSIGNKIVFSNNLRRLMAEQGVDRNKICKDLGVAYTTFFLLFSLDNSPIVDEDEPWPDRRIKTGAYKKANEKAAPP